MVSFIDGLRLFLAPVPAFIDKKVIYTGGYCAQFRKETMRKSGYFSHSRLPTF
jgi:hypothetical protein